MKYKVGDRVRMADNVFYIKKDDVCTIKRIDDDLFYFLDEEENVGMTKGMFSHLVISEITDEMINRFKNEKIAWHFKKKEDYEKTLDILYSKGVVYKSQRWLFNYNCIQYNFEQEGLERQNIGHFKKEEFEIIEIMNPVYVHSNLKIDEEWIDIDVVRYVENNLWTQYKDYKKQYYYKNQNVEVMFQQYMQQKKIPDLEKKVENQKVEIKNLHNKIDELQKTLTYEMSYSKTLAKENYELKKQIGILLDDVSFYKGRISVAREILDYED